MNTTNAPLIDGIASLIHDGVPVVFQTMLSADAAPVALADVKPTDEEVVVGAVGFIGDANGMVHLHLTVALARTLASKMLGLPAPELDDEMVNDVVGELSNMVVGSVKSQLCDAGAPCKLTIPSIVRGKCLNIEMVSSAERRVLCFACGADRFIVEILMKKPTSGDDI